MFSVGEERSKRGSRNPNFITASKSTINVGQPRRSVATVTAAVWILPEQFQTSKYCVFRPKSCVALAEDNVDCFWIPVCCLQEVAPAVRIQLKGKRVVTLDRTFRCCCSRWRARSSWRARKGRKAASSSKKVRHCLRARASH